MRIIKQSTNTVFILLFVIVSAAGLLVEENQPCNTERDILLATDPSQNTQTYLKCVPANIGSIGFWNKLFCAPATKFDFVTQSCIQDLSTNGLGGTFNFNAFKSYTNTQAYKTPPQTKEQLPLVEPPLKIAILNNSCVNGETCIGNSICDISAGVCKCPYGHTADLSTLSCNEDKPDGGPMVVSTVQQEDGSFKFTFRSQGPYSFNQQLSDLTMAKPTYKKVDNPEKIEFVGAKYPAEMPTIKPFAVLKALFAKPGEACTDGKICGGGSYCMAPAMLCLCPGTLIEKHGECVHPVHETPAVEKVNVGGLCNTYSECQDDSSCVLGRCRCISPLLEIAGKCIFQMAPKEVGPGEVCENGEVCIKGSICSADIPVCICPVGTDLEDDICVPVLTTDTNTAPTLKPPTTMPQLPDTLPPTTAALPTTETSTTSSTTTTTTTTTPIPTTSTTTTIPPETKISTIYTMPTLTHTYPNRPLSAGAKFLKVSETCSLNTDCMMGAYCNGNTNPPTCQCLSTHVNVNGKCEKVIYPGQYGCKNDIQCSVSYPGSVCLDRQCNCPLGYRAIEQTCVSVSHRLLSPPGGSCDSEETCTGNSVCRNDYCVCREPNMIVINGLCLTSDILASTKVFETVTTVQTPSSPVYSTIGLKQNIGDRLAETIYQNTFGPTEPSTIANTPTTQLIPVLANTNGGRKAAPGMNCGPLDSCVGGSQCLDNFCICPQGTIADTVSGRCETAAEEEEDEEAVTEAVEEPRKEIIKTEKSLEVPQVKLSSLPSAPSIVNEVVVDECAKQGLLCRGGSVCRSIDITCQCPEDYVLLNDRCMPPTRRRFSQRKGKSSSVVNDQSTSYPNESCQDGQACVGGSECGPEKVRSIKELFHAKKVCTCPSSRPIIRDNVCTSVNSTQLEKIAGPGEECSFEVKCSENAECSQSLCRCNSGFIAISNECMKLPTAQSVSITNNVPSSDLKLQSAGGFGSNSGAKPRIVGAPIRRTKKIKNGGKGAITTTNEAGICPSGNEPTRDDATNKVISCSGMTPNCPPRSYCYVTGVADGIFNCCKSS